LCFPHCNGAQVRKGYTLATHKVMEENITFLVIVILNFYILLHVLIYLIHII
jgi:hypothetical protein